VLARGERHSWFLKAQLGTKSFLGLLIGWPVSEFSRENDSATRSDDDSLVQAHVAALSTNCFRSKSSAHHKHWEETVHLERKLELAKSREVHLIMWGQLETTACRATSCAVICGTYP
jgi:hypothetical protein